MQATTVNEQVMSTTQPFKPRTASEKQYYSIQALRFVAAFMVIILHSTLYTSERLDSTIQLYGLGYNGVRLFFVISGFVMIISSDTLVNKVSGWAIFALKRIIRIVPLYWIATTFKLLIVVSAPSVTLHARIDWPYILKSYCLIPSINVDGEIAPLLGVGWTLIFEMFFYFLFSVSLLLKTRTISFVGSFLLILSIASIFKTSDWPPMTVYADPIVLDFLFGMIAGKLIINEVKLPLFLAIPAIVVGFTHLFVPVAQLKEICRLGHFSLASQLFWWSLDVFQWKIAFAIRYHRLLFFSALLHIRYISSIH